MQARTYNILIGLVAVAIVGALAWPYMGAQMFGRIGVPELIVLAAIVGILVLVVRGTGGSSKSMYCQNCGTAGRPTTLTRGSFLIEVFLWLCFIIPGVIYSLWRVSSKEKVCPRCGAPHMIPADSPKARAALLAPARPPAPATLAPSGVPAVAAVHRRQHKDAVLLSALPIGDAAHHDLGSGHGFAMGVKGESYRQAALHTLDAGRLQRGEHVTFTADLVPEPTNPVDGNAIRVSIQGGAQVGYLSKEDAVWYRPVFEALAARHLIGVARAKLIGGVVPDKPSIGVMLDMNQPSDLLNALTPDGQPF